MTTTITSVYHIAQGGAALTAIQTAVAAVPTPQDVLSTLGLRVISDSTTTGSSEVLRTIVFGMLPSSAATATAQLNANGQLFSLTVTGAGDNYVRPPVVSFGGTSFDNQPNTLPKAHAGLKITSVGVTSAGSSYTAGAKAVVDNSNQPTTDPNFVSAQLSITVIGGHVTGVAIVNAGKGYTSIPKITVVDPSGSGAVITITMGVSDIEIDYVGEGLIGTTVILTPVYKSFFPDSSDQAAPVKQLMTVAIAQAVYSPVFASPPIVA